MANVPIPAGIEVIAPSNPTGSGEHEAQTSSSVIFHESVSQIGSSDGSGSESESFDDSDLESTPSLIERIDLDCLSSLATKAHPEGLSCTVSPYSEVGSFNVVWFLEFSNGDEWVARIPRAPWSPMLERRMRSDMLGYEIIARRTSIPLAQIFVFSPGIDNELGYPFTLMSRAKGVQLSKLWFDKAWFTDEHRRTLFHSFAENMSQLKDITFPKIGSLELDDDGVLGVGPVLPSWKDLLDQPDVDYNSWALPGPFRSIYAFFSTIIAQRTLRARNKNYQIQLTLLRMFALSLPNLSLDGPPFVLSIPDFGLQDVFVNDNGEISCLIDWDGIVAVPRQGGYARYPSWLTRDWDPWGHGYFFSSAQPDPPPIPPREVLKKDSPAMLKQYREEYLEIYKSVDPTGAYYTRNSDVFEAIQKAYSDWVRLDGILDELTHYAFGIPCSSRYFVTSTRLLRTLQQGVWSSDYTRDAEKFASRPTE